MVTMVTKGALWDLANLFQDASTLISMTSTSGLLLAYARGRVSFAQNAKWKECTMMGYGKRVLVADDEESVGRLLVGQLELHYFAAVAVADGLQALRELHQRHFDAVITDLHMPYLDGLDLLRQCHLVWPQLPVILMSGNLLGTVRPAAAQGAFACLPKPVDTERLIHVLSEATHTGDPRSSHVDMLAHMLEARRCLARGDTLMEEIHAGDRLLDTDEQSLARRRPPTASVLRNSGIDRLQAGSTVETSRTT